MEPKRTRPKETAGLLMSIIRTLSSSADAKQREEEKAKLEKAFKESDKKLDTVLTKHLKDTTAILQAFSKISTRISTSQERIRAIKDNLQSCKNLLHCKRDELRKLWIDGIEQKTVAAMLDQIEGVKDVCDKLQSHIDKKHYLTATELIVNSVSLLDGDLKEVDALREVKEELLVKKEGLYETLVEELHRQVYVKSTSSVVKEFQRQGSLRQSKKDKSSLIKAVLTHTAQIQGDEYIDPRLHSLKSVSLEEIAKPRQITEDLNVDPEDDPVQFITIIVQCLALLRKLPEAIDVTPRKKNNPASMTDPERQTFRQGVQAAWRNAPIPDWEAIIQPNQLSDRPGTKMVLKGVENGHYDRSAYPMQCTEESVSWDIRTRIRPGLSAIVVRSSQQVSDNAYFEGEDLQASHQPQYLLELLELILQQFKMVAHTHRIVLANLQRVKVSLAYLGDFCLYDTVEVWTKIQAVLQVLLNDYLDIRNTTGRTATSTNFDAPTTDIGAYFAKKRPNKPKKFALFRFDASSHAISMNSYLREQRQEFYGSGELLNDDEDAANKMQFVCKPMASNITVIHNPLKKFIKEVETESKMPPGTSTLHNYITEFIQNIFLGQVLYNIQNSIDSATKGFVAQRDIIDIKTQKELGVSKPLLLSTVTVAGKLRELKEFMHDLPDYADQFLNMICKVLQEYRETCHSCYKGIVMSDSEEKRTISATWAKDEDINRFLRSLPSWHTLTDQQATDLPDVSEEDMRALNSKESDILTSNLSSTDCLIPRQEIIQEVVQLRTLANMCESLEWFSSQIRALAQTFYQEKQEKSAPVTPTTPSTPPSSPTKELVVSENTLQTLKSLARDFQELGYLCLLVLHLEVRVHCFYHLLPVATQTNYSSAIDDMDPDAHVIKLNKDLQSMEEVIVQSIQPKKFKYIFEGLGHLVSSILINSTQYFKRINENGIKKMCRNIFAVQQCLTNITTNRESDLDHARQYYELLYLTPDEILDVIKERGSQFSEHQYSNLIALAHRSQRGAREEDLELIEWKLKDILTGVILNQP